MQVEEHSFYFTGPGVEVAIPFGISDLARDAGWVNVGVDHDTSAFAVASIRRWWAARGRTDYPQAGRLLITADTPAAAAAADQRVGRNGGTTVAALPLSTVACLTATPFCASHPEKRNSAWEGRPSANERAFMPRDQRFAIPFPSRISPDVSRSRSRNHVWVREQGLVMSDRAMERYVSWDIPAAMARTYPYAVGEELDLVTDTMSLLFLFDDQMYGSAQAERSLIEPVIMDMIAILYRPLGSSACSGSPVARTWAELWPTMCQGMSAGWRARAARNWHEHLWAVLSEERNHRDQVFLSITDYEALRSDSVGLESCWDMIERCGGYEVPAVIMDSPPMRSLRRSAVHVTAYINDVQSVEREEANQDPNNLVRVLEHTQQLSRGPAVSVACSIVQERLEQLPLLEHEVAGLVRARGLGTDQARSVTDFISGLHDWIVGNYEWGRSSGRYVVQSGEGVQEWTGELIT